jgi:hypothetical protein
MVTFEVRDNISLGGNLLKPGDLVTNLFLHEQGVDVRRLLKIGAVIVRESDGEAVELTPEDECDRLAEAMGDLQVRVADLEAENASLKEQLEKALQNHAHDRIETANEALASEKAVESPKLKKGK